MLFNAKLSPRFVSRLPLHRFLFHGEKNQTESLLVREKKPNQHLDPRLLSSKSPTSSSSSSSSSYSSSSSGTPSEAWLVTTPMRVSFADGSPKRYATDTDSKRTDAMKSRVHIVESSRTGCRIIISLRRQLQIATHVSRSHGSKRLAAEHTVHVSIVHHPSKRPCFSRPPRAPSKRGQRLPTKRSRETASLLRRRQSTLWPPQQARRSPPPWCCQPPPARRANRARFLDRVPVPPCQTHMLLCADCSAGQKKAVAVNAMTATARKLFEAATVHPWPPQKLSRCRGNGVGSHCPLLLAGYGQQTQHPRGWASKCERVQIAPKTECTLTYSSRSKQRLSGGKEPRALSHVPW